MKYIFEKKDLQVKDSEIAVLFIDFTGKEQLVVCRTDEKLPLCLVKPGTCPVISM